ncbi:hypothetical protein KBC75_01690 [Candidatus Shapirobacteria bacterium]|nr:hypothetical protein [Candidatus Shapirobacteria bacterium]
MHYTARSFIGRSTPGFWAQYWENEPDDREVSAARGHLFGLISIHSTDHSFDSSALGHKLIDQINLVFTPQNLLSSLKNIISQHTTSTTTITVVLAVTHQNTLYLTSFNQGSVCLRRNSSISRLLTGTEKQYFSLSGPLHANDQIFLVTNEFISSFGWEQVKANLFLPRVQDIEESFLNSMYSSGDQTSLAAAHLTVHFDDDDQSVITPPPSPSVTVNISRPTITNYQSPVTNIVKSPTYVSHQDTGVITRRRHLNIVLAILVLAGLIGVSVYGYQRNQKTKTETQYQTYKSVVVDKINSSKAVRNLNLDSAQSLAKEAKDIVAKMALLKIHQTEITDFQKQISDILTLTGSSENFNPPVAYDTTLINSSARYTEMVLAKNLVYLLDSTSGRIDQVDPVKKSTAIVAKFDDLKSTYSLAENNGLVYVIKDQKINLVNKSELVSKIDISADVPDFSTGSIRFWNGAIYLLTTDKNDQYNLYKFNSNSSGFGAGTVWLKDGVALPTSPSSFAINGSVWVIGRTGQLTPYTRGAKDQFKFNSASFTKVNNLVTSLDSELIAFTDGDSQVYIYRKNGESSARYNLGSRQISSLALDSANNQLLVLCTDQKIYKISL